MTELKEVTLTKKQANELKERLRCLKREDFIWELERNYSDFFRAILARISGRLSFSNMPFTPVYHVIIEFTRAAWDLWRE